MLEKGRAARPPMIAALAPALERAGPLWYRLLPVIRAAKPEVWSCEHSSMDRPTERIVNHLLRCVGKFGHGVSICAGAAARTSTKLGVRNNRGVRRASSPAMLASSSRFSGRNRFSFWTRALAAAMAHSGRACALAKTSMWSWRPPARNPRLGALGTWCWKRFGPPEGGPQRLNGRSVGPQRARRIRFAVSSAPLRPTFLICCAASCMPRDMGLATS